MEKLLEIRDVTKQFGGVVAVDRVSFDVKEGETVAIIGPNGAGKTTLFNVISAVETPTSGEVWFQGERIDGKPMHSLARKGIARTFQNLQIFENMTVAENVMLGAHIHMRTNLISAGFQLPRAKRDNERSLRMAEEALRQVGLEAYKEEIAGTLPYGLQKLLEIARAIVIQPKLLLLDEPMAGLNEAESRNLARLLQKIKEQGCSFLFIEHDVNMVMEIADRIVVLDFGEKIAEGTPAEIRKDPKVIAAYLGEEDDR